MSGPKLRAGIVVIEQNYRGEQAFLAKDPTTHKYFRFRPAEAAVLRAFDGSRTIEEVAVELAHKGMTISASAIEAFARTLGGLGLIERTLAERTGQQLDRLRTERHRRRPLFHGEALRMRWSVGDPGTFFARTIGWFQWCFTPGFVVASVALFLAYGWVLASHWHEFNAATSATFGLSHIGVGDFGVLLCTLLILTLVHELAHGFACTQFGGEVHELGFMLLYLMPAFYCNVNDAWSFPEKRARLWVTASGMWVELVCTAVAAIVWALAAPDTLLSEFALAAMLVGGFTTLLTNANPLLPLDGYFGMADYLELPNLRQRSAAYMNWWFRRHLLRLDMPAPEIAERDKRIFLSYGVLSALYIGGFMTWLGMKVVGFTYRSAGFLAAAVLVVAIVAALRGRLVAVWRGAVLAVRARAGGSRWRRWGRRAPLAVGIVLVVAALLPWDLKTGGHFTVMPARTSAVTAPDSGVITAVYPEEGRVIEAGEPVASILSLELNRALARSNRSVDSLGTSEQLARSRAQAGMAAQLEAESQSARATAGGIQSRVEQTIIRARIGGTMVTPHPEQQIGRQVDPGDTLMMLQDLTTLEARARLSAPGSAQILPGQRVRLISYDDVGAPFDGVVLSVAPVGGADASGALDVRVSMPTTSRLRAGAAGEVRVLWGKSTLLGALWWAIRGRIRNDLLL
ncbi:MAG: HlyD family efflux transporter periplasmic adaptor subunit [Gemmatimonadota bacterium]